MSSPMAHEDKGDYESSTNSFDLGSRVTLLSASSTQATSIMQSPYWNICLLALAWAWTLTTSTLLTTIGPLSASELGNSDSWAAFTIGVFLIGAAASSVPSAYLFRNYGRFGGFSFGCFCQILGSILGTLAMTYQNSMLLFCGCFSIGLGQGIGQFYRFSAVEMTASDLKSKAVTYVLTGGIIAAFLGPTTAQFTVDFIGKVYVGSFATMAIIGFINELTIMLVQFPVAPAQRKKLVVDLDVDSRRSILTICTQPLFMISCSVATLAHTLMVMIMSSVTLAMKADGFPFSAGSLVMELHFFAMFSPGFLTGSLIKSYGAFLIALIGVIISAAALIVLAIGIAEWNYIVGMMLLGIGWNFSFSAGTVMLTGSYRPQEAPDVQAVNDVILFSIAGAGSLVSGYVFGSYGWLTLIYVVAVMVGLNLILFVVAWGLRQQVDASVDGQSGPNQELPPQRERNPRVSPLPPILRLNEDDLRQPILPPSFDSHDRSPSGEYIPSRSFSGAELDSFIIESDVASNVRSLSVA